MNEDQMITVARYLEGDLEGEEKTAFEAALHTDASLQAQVAEYKDIHQSLKARIAPDEQDQQVQDTLSGMREQYFKANTAEETLPVSAGGKSMKLKPYIKWMSLAAVLVIGLLVWAPWSSRLYDKYAYSKQMSIAERGSDQQAELGQAAEQYNKGNYDDARKTLLKLYTENPQNPLLAYYFAITLIETGQSYEGRTILMSLSAGGSVFKYDATFYAALSLIKEGKEQEAITWLEKIPAGESNYDKARALLAELKK